MSKSKLRIPDVVKDNFRFSTLSFLFIIAYVNLFQVALGPENTIVGVIFAIMMSASMVRDLTATPLRHLWLKSLMLVWMALAAFLVDTLPAPLSFLTNFMTLLMILYAYTYEYSSHLYFPYILSYLFLVFISPVDGQQLPRRMLGMVVGAVSIILYQWFMGRKRVVETARDELGDMIVDIRRFISYRLGDSADRPDLSDIRSRLCRLSQTVYDRRKKILCVSDASFSMIDAGRGLEHLLILVHELPEGLSARDRTLLANTGSQLQSFHAFLQQETKELPPLNPVSDFEADNPKVSELFYKTLTYIRDRMLHMTDPQRQSHYPKTALSLKIRLAATLDMSPVRAIYAIRVALLLSCATWLVQSLALPHGRWLLFTLASVSLPYADDVPGKIKKRTIATVVGGLISVAIYSLVPSPAGRTMAMMLSGYVSFYFHDYTETFACSTIGALGGAVFMDAFGLKAVGTVFVIRLGYILAGVAIGYLVNCLLFPYGRAKATKQLWKKYKAITELLTNVCHKEEVDTQLYYHLVILAHLLEEKLSQNAHLEDWKELPKLLSRCREQVRDSHRSLIANRNDTPVYEPGHLI